MTDGSTLHRLLGGGSTAPDGREVRCGVNDHRLQQRAVEDGGHGSGPVGQRRMRELHDGRTDRLEVSPTLWAGVGLVRAVRAPPWWAATSRWPSGSRSTTRWASTSSCCPDTRTWRRPTGSARACCHSCGPRACGATRPHRPRRHRSAYRSHPPGAPEVRPSPARRADAGCTAVLVGGQVGLGEHAPRPGAVDFVGWPASAAVVPAPHAHRGHRPMPARITSGNGCSPWAAVCTSQDGGASPA
ncbi:hypothetical protein SAMN04488000_12797 [Lentzea albida]|uniref:Uncharacterized protein n=1 Tax=Lentzea albida TaxID=65499 RepID=A0A1H9X5E8_9PSEU|nr:hypothetical protein SAMN04488000_12797 [Lentzea albida]